MKTLFESDVSVVNGNELTIVLRSIDTGAVMATASRVVEDPKVLEIAQDIVDFPVEQINCGVFGDKPSLKDILASVVEQAEIQVGKNN